MTFSKPLTLPLSASPRVYLAPSRVKLVGFGSVRIAFPPSSDKVISDVSKIALLFGSVNVSSSNSTTSAVLSLLGVIESMIGPARSFVFPVLVVWVDRATLPALS